MDFTIEETYRIVDARNPDREIGLAALETSMSEGGLHATGLRLMLLPSEGLAEGEYTLQFVKKLATFDGQRRRTLRRLAVSNDRGAL